ncbi:MAG: hypothetical protein R3E72_07440 [Steroidobacteraceae bacterium]
MKRRTTLGLIGGGFIGSGLIGKPISARSAVKKRSRIPLNPASPQDIHFMQRKLAYTYDDRLVFWYVRAVRYGLRDGMFTPFWNMHVGFAFRIEDLGEYKFRSTALGKIFYTDLKTGELLEYFDNPYTGERREVQQPRLDRLVRVHGLRGVERPTTTGNKRNDDGPPQGRVTHNDDIGPAWIIGDDVWVNGDIVERRELPNDLGQLVQVNDWFTSHGSISDVSNPDVKSAPSTHTFNDINTFNSPWIGMDGIDASSVSRGFGRKFHSVQEMPNEWRRFMGESHPDVLADIRGAIDG